MYAFLKKRKNSPNSYKIRHRKFFSFEKCLSSDYIINFSKKQKVNKCFTNYLLFYYIVYLIYFRHKIIYMALSTYFFY